MWMVLAVKYGRNSVKITKKADSCARVEARIALFLAQSAKPTHSLVVANKKARNTFPYSSTIDYLYFTISSHLLSAFLAILTEFRPT